MQVGSELSDVRTALRGHKQQVHKLLADGQGRSAHLGTLDSRVRQVATIAEEHARYLVSLGDALHERAIAAPRFRSSAIAYPTVLTTSQTAPLAMRDHTATAQMAAFPAPPPPTQQGTLGVGTSLLRPEPLDPLSTAGGLLPTAPTLGS